MQKRVGVLSVAVLLLAGSCSSDETGKLKREPGWHCVDEGDGYCDCSDPDGQIAGTPVLQCDATCCFYTENDKGRFCGCSPLSSDELTRYGGCQAWAKNKGSVAVPYCPITPEEVENGTADCPTYDPQWGCGSCHPCPAWANDCDVNGQCSLRCLGRHADCNGDVEDGCETNIDFSPDNCGACGQPAEGGICSRGCEGATANCDGDESNGCEVDLSQSPNCGGCGIECLGECVPVAAVDQPSGVSYRCRVPACPDGRYDWNRDLTDGCESKEECPADPMLLNGHDRYPCTQVGARCFYETETLNDDTCWVCEDSDQDYGLWREVGADIGVPNVTGRFVHRCLTPASGCPNYPGRTTDVCTPGDVCCWQSGKQWFQAACDGHWRSPVRVSSCTPQITP